MSHPLALTLPFNFSFAENRGTGTLGDGFIGLDSSCDDGCCPGSRSSAYVVDIRSVDVGPVTPVPEPPVWALLGIGAAGWSALVRRRRDAVSFSGCCTDQGGACLVFGIGERSSREKLSSLSADVRIASALSFDVRRCPHFQPATSYRD